MIRPGNYMLPIDWGASDAKGLGGRQESREERGGHLLRSFKLSSAKRSQEQAKISTQPSQRPVRGMT